MLTFDANVFDNRYKKADRKLITGHASRKMTSQDLNDGGIQTLTITRGAYPASKLRSSLKLLKEGNTLGDSPNLRS